jgi:pimeloyl-ACP methyl ester carboxylesterase
VWFRLVPRLQHQHRVITLDNLGTDRTGVPPGPYSMRMLADAVSAVVHESGEESVHVLGISLGGLIAQELTLNEPAIVRSLCLVATHAGIPHSSADPGVLEALTEAATLEPEKRYDFLLPFAHSASTPRERLDEDCAVRAAHPTSEAGYNNQLQGVATWERLSELAQIDVPTLVLHGEEDRMVPLPSGALLRDAIPGARMTVLPECGHQLFTDQPDKGAAVVLDWLAERDS